MRVLFVCSEVAPFSKSGGLGDVAGALPAALEELGDEVRVVTPLYGSVNRSGLKNTGESIRLRFPFGEQRANLWAADLSENHQILFLDHPDFYARGGLYQGQEGDYPDNHRRFAFLSVGALAAAEVTGFAADIVHFNDWQTGLGPLALHRGFRGSLLAGAQSVFTVHNLAYQGLFPKSAMADLGLPWDVFVPEGLEFYDSLSFLKAGLAYAEVLTTVSPTYAREIQEPELGCGLDGFLQSRRGALHGILNGVDYGEWNPSADPHLPRRYSVEQMAGKHECKRELLRRFSLPHTGAALKRPLFASVSRLVEQKGSDLLISAMRLACEGELSFVGLGSGDPILEEALQSLAVRHPTKAAAKVGFDNALSHLIEAGADFFLMPSRFEPCGLNQMYSLRYGTVPVVRATGGLDDTVIDISSPEGTGLKFRRFERGELLGSIGRALQLYENRPRLQQVQRRGMAKDFSWTASAEKYQQLYRGLIAEREL